MRLKQRSLIKHDELYTTKKIEKQVRGFIRWRRKNGFPVVPKKKEIADAQRV